jgi:hypothetical protein
MIQNRSLNLMSTLLHFQLKFSPNWIDTRHQPGELGASARRVNRAVRSLFENKNLKDIVEGDVTKPGAASC